MHVTKTTPDGTDTPSYSPIGRGHVLGGLRSPTIRGSGDQWTVADELDTLLDVADHFGLDDERIDSVRFIRDLVRRADGPAVMVRTERIHDALSVVSDLRTQEVAGVTYVCHEVGESAKALRDAVRQHPTRDLGEMTDDKWDLVGAQGVGFTPSTGMAHLVDDEGVSFCNRITVEGDDIVRDVNLLDFDRRGDGVCHSCFWQTRAHKKLGLSH